MGQLAGYLLLTISTLTACVLWAHSYNAMLAWRRSPEERIRLALSILFALLGLASLFIPYYYNPWGWIVNVILLASGLLATTWFLQFVRHMQHQIITSLIAAAILGITLSGTLWQIGKSQSTGALTDSLLSTERTITENVQKIREGVIELQQQAIIDEAQVSSEAIALKNIENTLVERQYSVLVVTNQAGRITARGHDIQSFGDPLTAEYPWAFPALSGETVQGIISGTNGIPLIAVATPITRDQVQTGVLIAGKVLSELISAGPTTESQLTNTAILTPQQSAVTTASNPVASTILNDPSLRLRVIDLPELQNRELKAVTDKDQTYRTMSRSLQTLDNNPVILTTTNTAKDNLPPIGLVFLLFIAAWSIILIGYSISKSNKRQVTLSRPVSYAIAYGAVGIVIAGSVGSIALFGGAKNTEVAVSAAANAVNPKIQLVLVPAGSPPPDTRTVRILVDTGGTPLAKTALTFQANPDTAVLRNLSLGQSACTGIDTQRLNEEAGTITIACNSVSNTTQQIVELGRFSIRVQESAFATRVDLLSAEYQTLDGRTLPTTAQNLVIPNPRRAAAKDRLAIRAPQCLNTETAQISWFNPRGVETTTYAWGPTGAQPTIRNSTVTSSFVTPILEENDSYTLTLTPDNQDRAQETKLNLVSCP